jgi:hypothetical protein
MQVLMAKSELMRFNKDRSENVRENEIRGHEKINRETGAKNVVAVIIRDGKWKECLCNI